MTVPAPNQQPPKYRHQKARNLAVVRIDGKDYYLGRYNSPESHEKYRRLIAELYSTGTVSTVERARDGASTGNGPTVNDVILAYLRHASDFYRRADGTPTGEL